MKAFRIISTEFSANVPSVFLFLNGNYYGCMIYPKGNNYPQDVKFWETAEGSDLGRRFKIEEVEISLAQLEEIESSKDRHTTRELILAL